MRVPIILCACRLTNQKLVFPRALAAQPINANPISKKEIGGAWTRTFLSLCDCLDMIRSFNEIWWFPIEKSLWTPCILYNSSLLNWLPRYCVSVKQMAPFYTSFGTYTFGNKKGRKKRRNLEPPQCCQQRFFFCKSQQGHQPLPPWPYIYVCCVLYVLDGAWILDYCLTM